MPISKELKGKRLEINRRVSKSTMKKYSFINDEFIINISWIYHVFAVTEIL